MELLLENSGNGLKCYKRDELYIVPRKNLFENGVFLLLNVI
jgi:hypothetical protein